MGFRPKFLYKFIQFINKNCIKYTTAPHFKWRGEGVSAKILHLWGPKRLFQGFFENPTLWLG